jgi:hypothetical protein
MVHYASRRRAGLVLTSETPAPAAAAASIDQILRGGWYLLRLISKSSTWL